ncbi:hypothetical protein HMI54_008495 [Coelomomyces lativittatus]|nr:hypothetical protein HMI54_008495 [Coelomomyces lativittatus]
MQHLNGLHVLLCTWLPNLVRDVLSQVISALAQSILSLLRSIEQIDTHGRDQLGLELTFLQHSLQTFTSSSLNKVFEAIQNEVLADASPYLQDLLDQALQTTRMQFYGLAYQPPQTS